MVVNEGLIELTREVDEASCGSSEGWEQLVDRFAGLIWSVARNQGLSATDAAEVSQTTWLRLAEHIGDVRDPTRLGAWLATTARREAIRIGRLGSRYVLVDPWQNLESASDEELDAELLSSERDAVIQHAMALLPTRCQELLTALVLNEPPRSYAQFSEGTGMPIGSVGPTRGRCLDHLRQLITRVESGERQETPMEMGIPVPESLPR